MCAPSNVAVDNLLDRLTLAAPEAEAALERWHRKHGGRAGAGGFEGYNDDDDDAAPSSSSSSSSSVGNKKKKKKVRVEPPLRIANAMRRAAASESDSREWHSRRQLKAVRVGHPARQSPRVLNHSLDSLISRADGTEVVNEIRDELRGLNRVLYGGSGRRDSKNKNSAKNGNKQKKGDNEPP